MSLAGIRTRSGTLTARPRQDVLPHPERRHMIFVPQSKGEAPRLYHTSDVKSKSGLKGLDIDAEINKKNTAQ